MRHMGLAQHLKHPVLMRNPGSQRPSLRGTGFDAGQGAPTEVPHILAGAEVRWAEPDGGDFPRPLRAMLGGKTALETSGAYAQSGKSTALSKRNRIRCGARCPNRSPAYTSGSRGPLGRARRRGFPPATQGHVGRKNHLARYGLIGRYHGLGRAVNRLARTEKGQNRRGMVLPINSDRG